MDSSHFNQCEPGIFNDIIDSLANWGDYWMVLADFRSYIEAQERAALAYQDQEWWTKASILNTARSGKFSTDRTMEEYNDESGICPRSRPSRSRSRTAVT